MRYYDSVVGLIGNTPLVKLRRVTEGIRATVLAKVEYFNPGGSVKDRIAVRMIDEQSQRRPRDDFSEQHRLSEVFRTYRNVAVAERRARPVLDSAPRCIAHQYNAKQQDCRGQNPQRAAAARCALRVGIETPFDHAETKIGNQSHQRRWDRAGQQQS